MLLKKAGITSLLIIVSRVCVAQLIPDYVADPSVVYFNGYYYLYGTSDIDHGLAQMGPPVVWKSADLLNWSYSGMLIQGMEWNKPYDYTDAKGVQKKGYFRYWAPGKIFKKGNQYYLYATVVKPDESLGTYLLIGAKPEGPFKFSNGTGVYFNQPEKNAEEAKPVAPDIDGDPFVDDDGLAYIFWRRRNAAKLSADWKSLDGATVAIPTKRAGYSEGPFLFKRNNVYYYVYTLSGNANYCYAYMMSTEGPLGPFKAPDHDDIILQSNVKTGIWGPGHGNVFQISGTDDYAFAYLEYGNGGTTRQVFANRMGFNADGTIKPIHVDRLGIAGMVKAREVPTIKPVTVTASSYKAAVIIKATIDTAISKLPTMSSRYSGPDVVAVQKEVTFKPENAVDGSNGTYWMAASPRDSVSWLQVDLGSVKTLKTCNLYFVESTLGHTYKVEKSKDGTHWENLDTPPQGIIQSPQVIGKIGAARYLKITITSGAPGLWEMKIY